jgi:hypothetical protein
MTYIQPGPKVEHIHEWVIVGMDLDRTTGKVVQLRHACFCGEKAEWMVKPNETVTLLDQRGGSR